MSPTIEKHPFRELIVLDAELAELRRDYAKEDPRERRAAADIAYHRHEALRLLGQAGDDPWAGCVTALAIDPEYAPAILTVGTLEAELGRCSEALPILQKLLELPDDTEDLAIIIDKAATYLGREKGEYQVALEMFRAGYERFPDELELLRGIGWCEGHLGNFEKGVEYARLAMQKAPDDAGVVSDLGWALLEAERYDEALEMLEKAVEMDPDDELARGNLKVARRRAMASAKGESWDDDDDDLDSWEEEDDEDESSWDDDDDLGSWEEEDDEDEDLSDDDEGPA